MTLSSLKILQIHKNLLKIFGVKPEKLNGKGAESTTSYFANHPVMIEANKIRDRNLGYLKCMLIAILAFLFAHYLKGNF